MTTGEELLAAGGTVLVIDWPTKAVPEGFARVGLRVVVHGGPGPDEYHEYRREGDEVVSEYVGQPPERADFVYTFRPFEELPGIVATAESLGATAVWDGTASTDKDERAQARALVEGAGLAYLDDPYP